MQTVNRGAGSVTASPIGTMQVAGHGDKTYPFEVYEWDASTGSFAGIPCKAGVFFVGARGKDGKLDDVRLLFLKHVYHELAIFPIFTRTLGCLRKHGADCVGFLHLESEQDRESVLMELVMAHDAPCNRFRVKA